MTIDTKINNNLPKSGFTIPLLDTLIKVKEYKGAKKCISQMFAKDGFRKDQLVELLFRAAFIFNKCDEAVAAERYARQGLVLLKTLPATPQYDTMCWRYLSQIYNSLQKQNRGDETKAILQKASVLNDLSPHDKFTVFCRYARCLIASTEFTEAAQWLKKARDLAETPVLKSKVCYLWVLYSKKTEDWDAVILAAQAGIKLLRESDIGESRELWKLESELYKAKICKELNEY
jgi:tetratricopeptide (TPR) repeat protein